MFIACRPSAKYQKQNACLSCGATNHIEKRRYCSIKCRQHLRQKLNARSGLLSALNTRYATFYFTGQMIILDVVPYGRREIFRYQALRTSGSKPADDFGKMTNLLGNAWWAEEKRTKKTYLASQYVLEMAERLVISEGLRRPRLIKAPSVKAEYLVCLGIKGADLGVRDLPKVIKNAYRSQVKIHHPDKGGSSADFRKIYEAYQDLLRWAENPKFMTRRGFPDKWYYDGENQKWVQPLPAKK